MVKCYRRCDQASKNHAWFKFDYHPLQDSHLVQQYTAPSIPTMLGTPWKSCKNVRHHLNYLHHRVKMVTLQFEFHFGEEREIIGSQIKQVGQVMIVLVQHIFNAVCVEQCRNSVNGADSLTLGDEFRSELFLTSPACVLPCCAQFIHNKLPLNFLLHFIWAF